MKTILGIFDDPTAARRALDALRDGPLPLEDVSIVSRSTESGAAVANDTDVSAGEGAAVGAVWGGLVGLAALLIPGVGPFIAFGALGAALTGALTGAVVGGIAAALIDFGGISEDEARRYESLIHEGKTLVAVKARDEDAAEVRRILSSYGAEPATDDVSAATTPSHVAMYDEHGQRVDQEIEYATAGTSASPHGIYDMPNAADRDPYATRQMPAAREAGRSWTSGEVVGEGQGQGPRTDTGTYDATQWVGEGQDEPADDPTKRQP